MLFWSSFVILMHTVHKVLMKGLLLSIPESISLQTWHVLFVPIGARNIQDDIQIPSYALRSY